MRNNFLTQIGFVQNNYGFDLGFQLKDNEDVVVDLTGATLKFIAQLDADYPTKMEGTMALVDAVNGKCRYTVAQNDFPTAGTWQAQVQVTYVSGEVITFDGIVLTVAPALPLT